MLRDNVKGYKKERGFNRRCGNLTHCRNVLFLLYCYSAKNIGVFWILIFIFFILVNLFLLLLLLLLLLTNFPSFLHMNFCWVSLTDRYFCSSVFRLLSFFCEFLNVLKYVLFLQFFLKYNGSLNKFSLFFTKWKLYLKYKERKHFN